MIIGNPYKFAVCVQKINEWNSDNSGTNGVFLFFIDGFIIPAEIENVDIEREIDILIKELLNISEDKSIFEMDKNEAVEKMYHITFPSDIDCDNDYRFHITPDEIADRDFFIFVVSNKDKVRFLATSRLKYDIEESMHLFENMKVYESIITYEELKELVVKLKKYKYLMYY